jgi:hypothetical protein
VCDDEAGEQGEGEGLHFGNGDFFWGHGDMGTGGGGGLQGNGRVQSDVNEAQHFFFGAPNILFVFRLQA